MSKNELSSIGIFTIATNEYVFMIENQLSRIASQIKSLNWKYVIATDQVKHLTKFLQQTNLVDHVRIISCPPYRFPLASMLRFKYLRQNMTDFSYICYLDCDMDVENPSALDKAIRTASSVSLVRHPGWDRNYGLALGTKERIFELYTNLVYGNLGSWETDKRSEAYVPRNKRFKYFAGGIFFGQSSAVIDMSRICDEWMDSDLRKGMIPTVHDESYLNRWAVMNTFSEVGPEFCYTEFPWLPKLEVIVRALDKSQMKLPLDEISIT